jgi:hypothetical protein
MKRIIYTKSIIMTAQLDQRFSNLLNVVSFRTETLNKLTVKNRVEVSSLLERYTRLCKERLSIVGKLYGSKKYQAVDEQLHTSMKTIREKVESILDLY